jgi:hypothetical protein
MWIHLNRGDEGLTSFLRRAASLSCSMLVVEPQRWKSYKSAVERCRRLGMAHFEHFKALTWRNNVEEMISNFIILKCPFEVLRVSVAAKDPLTRSDKVWGRTIMIFSRDHTAAEHSAVGDSDMPPAKHARVET